MRTAFPPLVADAMRKKRRASASHLPFLVPRIVATAVSYAPDVAQEPGAKMEILVEGDQNPGAGALP